ncbi:zf-H2C2 2 domain containing protein [Asbolus verrucosus]|uniref:Zf-H2C2 2 domain containing protein n=1 Tax=Asbolus verrucosus TaxID=1661398 RepID=A0A482WDF4_ASBVE|nr:zf-H2C2 2 domain containing protein [Asbolus verrucosus]
MSFPNKNGNILITAEWGQISVVSGIFRSVHEGTKEFAAKCPECGKIFNDRGYLSSHMKIHRDKKEYACPHCPKRFNQRVAFTKKHHLKTHINFHTGLKPYSCQKCGLAFSQSSNMRTHYKKCILKSNAGPSENADADSSSSLTNDTR